MMVKGKKSSTGLIFEVKAVHAWGSYSWDCLVCQGTKVREILVLALAQFAH